MDSPQPADGVRNLSELQVMKRTTTAPKGGGVALLLLLLFSLLARDAFLLPAQEEAEAGEASESTTTGQNENPGGGEGGTENSGRTNSPSTNPAPDPPAAPTPPAPASPPVSSFSFSSSTFLAGVAQKALDAKRDRGDLPALGRLAEIKKLFPGGSSPATYADVHLQRIAALAQSSHAADNDSLVATLLENVSGTADSSLLDIGDLAARLLADRSLTNSFPASALFGQTDLTDNSFAADLTSVWGHLATDSFPTAAYIAAAGRNLSLASGSYDTSAPLSSGQDTILLGATSTLSLSGTVNFQGSAARIVLIGGDNLSFASGSSLDAALADLVVASRSDWSVSDATFAAGQKLYLRSLGDLTLANIDLTASDQVRFQALLDLSVDNARFSSALREIHMRATTIDLKNVDFPAATSVLLQSLKGPIDAKYPTFGVENRAYGRVNFLNNVSHGGNAIIDRSSFDLHGTKINVTKLP